MKLLLLLFFVGFAASSLGRVLDDASDKLLMSEDGGDDIKTELGKRLKEHLDDVLEKIKDAMEKGKTVKGDLLEKAKEIRDKLKDLKIDIGEKAKDLFNKIKDKARKLLDDLLEKLGLKDKEERSVVLQRDVVTEEGKKIQEILDQLLEKVKDAIDHGKEIKQDVLDKIKENLKKLKDLKVDIGERAKDLLERIKNKAKDLVDKFLEKLGLKDKSERSLHSRDLFKIKELLKKLKEAIKNRLDADALKEKIENLFGKGSELAEQLINFLKEKSEKGKSKLLDFIDRILGKDDDEEERETRSLAELWEKIRDYFKNLHIEIKEKFLKFGEWVKEVAGKALDKTKTKVENLKEIAKELVKHTKDVSKEVAVEALEFLRPYKEDLGALWDQVKDAVKEVLNRKS